MNELIKKNWKWILIILGIGVVVGFFIGRSGYDEKITVKYEKGKTVCDTVYSEKLIPYSTYIPTAPVLPLKHDTIYSDSVAHDVMIVDTAKIIANYIELKSYKNTLFDDAENGKLIIGSQVQYNNLIKLDYQFTPIQKTTTIVRQKTITPWLEVGYNSFGYYSTGGGVYYHNIGVGAKLETNLTEKGFSLSAHYKF